MTTRRISTDECNTFEEVRELTQELFDDQAQTDAKVCQLARLFVGKVVAVKERNEVYEQDDVLIGAVTKIHDDGLFDVDFGNGYDGTYGPESLVDQAPAKVRKGSVSMKTLFATTIAAILIFVMLFCGTAKAAYVATDINGEICANHDTLAEYLRDVFANITSNSFLFTPTDTAPAATEGMLYYNATAVGLKLRTDSAWVDVDVSGASSLDAAYGIGAGITVDNGAVTLTAGSGDDNVVLALVQGDTDAGVAALTADSAGNAAVILIAQTGSGTDIEGTDGWSISKASALIIEGGITDLTDGSTILMDTNNEIQFGDNSIDVSMNFSASTTLTWTTDTSVVTVDWGDLDSHIGLDDITFDVAGSDNTITCAGNATGKDLTIQQTGTGDVSLILQSAGSGTDALSLISSVADISLSSADNITRTAANDITDVTTDGPYTLTIGGSTNGKYVSTVADTFSMIAVDTVLIQNTEASKDITVDSAAGSVIIDGGEAIADAVTIQAPAGGVDITSAATFDIDLTATGGTVQVIASEAAANQFKVDAQGVIAGFAIVLETTDGGIQLNADGTNGNITIDAAGALTYVAPSLLINNDASTNTTGIGTGPTTGTVTLGGTGTQAIDVGTGAGIKTVTVGSTTTTSATTVQSGSGDLSITSTDDWTATASGAVALFSNAVQQTITLGNATSASSLDLKMGTGNFTLEGVAASTITIGKSDQSGTIKVGESTGALTLNLGTGGTAAKTIAIGDGADIGSITLYSGSGDLILKSTDAIKIAEDAVAQLVSIGNVTGASALTLESGTGDITLISTDAINIAENAVAQIVAIGNVTGASSLTLESGTGDITVTSTDAITMTSAGALNIGENAVAQTIAIGNVTGASSLTLESGTGDVTITSTDAIKIGENAAAQLISIGNVTGGSSLTLEAGTGNHVMTGAVATTYTIGNAAQTGTMKFGESSATMILNLGTGTGAHTIHIGDGGTNTQAVTIGSTSSASALTLQAGTGNFVATGDAATTYTIGNAAQTGAMKFGESSATGTVDIGTGTGARTVTVGGVTGAAATVVQSGTGDITITSTDAINIGANADQQLITIGNATDASSLDLKAGTGNFTLDGVAATTYTIGNAAQTGTIKLGESSATCILNLGTGTGAHTIHIGDGETASQIVEIGSVSSASSLTLQAGTGNFVANGNVATTYTIGNAAQTGTMKLGESSATMILNLGTGTGAHTIHIGDGGSATQIVTIGSTSSASALTLQAGSGEITVTGNPTVSGVAVFTAGQQSASVALTVDVEGNQTTIVQGTRFVTLTITNDADDVAILPATAIVGNIIRITIPVTGCELQTDDGGSDTINNVDCSGANELALTAGYIYEATCVKANTWIVNGWNNVGAAIATLTPDADS